MLFEDKKRTRTAPKKSGENDYAFYDSTGRTEFQVYRDLVDGWIAELPESERAETISSTKERKPTGR
jgi:hypothetical protein